MLQRPPYGRQKHNASDPTVFSLLGLLGFLVVFLLFFFSLVCVCACPYSHFLLILLPERLPLFTDICSNLASSTHWPLVLLSSTEKSEENIRSCPDFTTHQLEEAWRTLFPFCSAAAQWQPPTWSWSLTHRLTLASNKKSPFLPHKSYTRKLSVSGKCIPGTLKFTCLTRCHQCHLQCAHMSH